MPRTFPCPRCGEPSVWEGNEFRPFCSERCKLIDLGAWPMRTINYRLKMLQHRKMATLMITIAKLIYPPRWSSFVAKFTQNRVICKQNYTYRD